MYVWANSRFGGRVWSGPRADYRESGECGAKTKRYFKKLLMQLTLQMSQSQVMNGYKWYYISRSTRREKNK